MGAWIEIPPISPKYLQPSLSHPTWVRGLKCLLLSRGQRSRPRRTLHGCVD